MSTIKLAPSILAADFTRLGDQVREVQQAGADRIHVDVMDGHFVPNISMGPVVVQALRPVTTLPLEVHLMIEEPMRYADAFVKAGASSLLIHLELPLDHVSALRTLHGMGIKAGIVINPATPVDNLTESILEEVDLVLVMTVVPGFGGQAFMSGCVEKVRRVRELVQQVNPAVEVEVDGGIDEATGRECARAGANVLVAGSSIFRAKDGIAGAMARLQRVMA